MTDEERRHCEVLMAELDQWKPGMPPPTHPVEEHLLYAKKYMDDIKKDQRRLGRLLVLWVLVWSLLLATIYFVFRR